MLVHLMYEIGRLRRKCGRYKRSASPELLRTNGYRRIETFQDTFTSKEFLVRP